jgi:hypothetical protein
LKVTGGDHFKRIAWCVSNGSENLSNNDEDNDVSPATGHGYDGCSGGGGGGGSGDDDDFGYSVYAGVGDNRAWHF